MKIKDFKELMNGYIRLIIKKYATENVIYEGSIFDGEQYDNYNVLGIDSAAEHAIVLYI